MSAITDIVTAYAHGEIDFGQAREQLRQVPIKSLPSGGWDYIDIDSEGTVGELGEITFALGITPAEYALFAQSLAATPVGTARQEPGEGPDLDDPDLVSPLPPGQDGILDYLGDAPLPADPDILAENGVVVEKHYPGGKDHDQERHGDWSQGPSQDEEGASGEGETPDQKGGRRIPRPKSLSDIVGQERTVERLNLIVEASKIRGDQLPHLLFTGPPGLGKTTLARAVANDFGSNMVGPIIGSNMTRNSLQSVLLGLAPGDVLFIDEIHAMSRDAQEVLYPAMEDFEFDAKFDFLDAPIRTEIAPFTLIGATTSPEGLLRPFRDRFGQIEQLQYYEAETLAGLAQGTARKWGFELPDDVALELGKRARGTPRFVNQHVADLYDYLTVRGGSASMEALREVLSLHEIDSRGLNRDDRAVLRVLADYQGQPIGVGTLAQMLGHEPATIEKAIEPYLLREGLIQKTPRGRIITEGGLAHIEENAEFFTKSAASTVSIVKKDARRNLVFGWANVAMTPEGQVEDHQGHLIDLDDLESAAYRFVAKYRLSGDMHQGEGFGELVESLVVTEDKVEKGGFPRSMLGHWWVGFKVPPEHWDKVQKGDRVMFSIQGKARLEPLD
jgi:holliday junction DNA helicase RuvB